ncbi:MAG: EAL domain-containing protein, partial [Betaproteobacteria bacterium]
TYAEWDTIDTITAVRDALALRHSVAMIEADADAFELLRRTRPEIVFNIAEGQYGVSREAQIPAILGRLAAEDAAAVDALGEFRLRQDERGRVIGDFFKCRLSSVFQPVFAASGREVIAHEARVRCDGWGDDSVSPWGIFSMIAGDGALVRLDRLCRSLHVLNYAGRAEPAQLLFLRVEPRLLNSVKHDHGRVFAEVLRQCGVSPSRVVIEIPGEATEDRALVERASENYLARGYRLAITWSPAADAAALESIKPEFLRIDSRLLPAPGDLDPLVGRVHAWGGRAIAIKIDAARDLVLATRAGIDLLQGFLLGRPDFELDARRELGPVPMSIVRQALTGASQVAAGVRA